MAKEETTNINITHYHGLVSIEEIMMADPVVDGTDAEKIAYAIEELYNKNVLISFNGINRQNYNGGEK